MIRTIAIGLLVVIMGIGLACLREKDALDRPLFTLTTGSLTFSLAFDKDGSHIAEASYDKKVAIWNVLSGKQLCTLHDFPHIVKCVAFSPDECVLATGSPHSLGNRSTLFLSSNPKHIANVGSSLSVLRSPNMRSFEVKGQVWEVAFDSTLGSCVVGSGNTVTVFDITSKEARLQFDINVDTRRGKSLSLTPAGLMAIAGEGNVVQVWNLRLRCKKVTISGFEGRVQSVAIAPNGKTVAIGGYKDKPIELWDISGDEPSYRTAVCASDLGSKVNCVAYSTDGTMLAAGCPDGRLFVWDADTLHPLANIKAHGDEVVAIAFSPDGNILASCGYDERTCLWRIKG